MGQVFSNLIGTCNCSSEANNEDARVNEELNNLKLECNNIKDRLISLETTSLSIKSIRKTKRRKIT